MTFEKIVKSEFTYIYRLQTDIFDIFSCLHDVDKLLHHQIKNILFLVKKARLASREVSEIIL
jgi:hypothetical protein